MASTNKEAGRPAHDRTAIIDELKSRYPNGSEFTSADDLFAANPDLLPRLKTLKNTAKESFGMPLGKYLKSIGLIGRKASKGIQIVECKDQLLAKLNKAYPDKEVINLKCEHYSWYTTLKTLAQAEGFDSYEDFLAAYGFTCKEFDEEEMPEALETHMIIDKSNMFSESEDDSLRIESISAENLNEIFEMEKIEKAPRKSEYKSYLGETLSEPTRDERGFFGTVFRGLEKDIFNAKKILEKALPCVEIEKTDFKGIFQICVQCNAEKEIREIIKTIPALKMVTFHADWGTICGVYYSHSGYPYITKQPSLFPMILHIPKTQDEPWIYWRRADEKGFLSMSTLVGTWGIQAMLFRKKKTGMRSTILPKLMDHCTD